MQQFTKGCDKNSKRKNWIPTELLNTNNVDIDVHGVPLCLMDNIIDHFLLK